MDASPDLLEGGAASFPGIVLLCVGISDIIVSFLVFSKKLSLAEEKLSTATLPEQLHPLERQIKGLRYVIAMLQSTGVLLGGAGLYLIIR